MSSVWPAARRAGGAAQAGGMPANCTPAALHAPAEAERAEVLHEPELDFGCTILVLGLQVGGCLRGVAWLVHGMIGDK